MIKEELPKPGITWTTVETIKDIDGYTWTRNRYSQSKPYAWLDVIMLIFCTSLICSICWMFG